MTKRRLRAAVTALAALAVLALAPMPVPGADSARSGVTVRPFAPEAPLVETLTVSLLAELASDAPDLRGPAAGPIRSADPGRLIVPSLPESRLQPAGRATLRSRGFRARPTRAPPVLSC